MIRRYPLPFACALAGLGCIALGDGAAGSNALAAAAGSAFEAAPFLLIARFLAPVLGRRLGGLASLGGCGCSRGAIPGALALPAIALCALSFGPIPTIARTVTALVLLGRSGRSDRRPLAAPDDLFTDLERIAASAFLASLAAMVLAVNAPAFPRPLAFAAGVGLGVLAPCATAGIAVAAAFAHGTPALAYGVLCSAGISLGSARRRAHDSDDRHAIVGPERDARLGGALLACALASIVVRGPSGLVSPRLLVPIGIAAVLALATVPRVRSRARASVLVPLLMLGSLVAVPRPAPYHADATRLDDAFPGERLGFIGVASTGRGPHTTLTRYAITCCRLDATPISVRLDRRLGTAFEGRWVAVAGTLEDAGGSGLELNPERIHVITAPADPYVYR